MINDEQQLVGARHISPRDEYGSPIKTYDDGFGSLWLYAEVYGPMGVVRARTWHEAYEICQDEIMSRVAPEEVPEAYGLYVTEFGTDFFLVPEVDLPKTVTYWEDFSGEIPGRVVVGFSHTREEALENAFKVIERNQLDLIEGYEYQPNATGTGIVTYDLNGQTLVPLTPENAERFGIRIQVTESN